VHRQPLLPLVGWFPCLRRFRILVRGPQDAPLLRDLGGLRPAQKSRKPLYLYRRGFGKTGETKFHLSNCCCLPGRITVLVEIRPLYGRASPIDVTGGNPFRKRFVCVRPGRNRATLNPVNPLSRFRRFCIVFLAMVLALLGHRVLAQDSASAHKKKSASSTSAHKSTKPASKKSTSAHHHAPRKKVTSARAHSMKRTFVASSDLRPMARQLVEFRTPAAYAGVETYAHAHAGTEAGALAWFAIGYAHYLDAQYPTAIAAMQKAQPQIGELKDYTAFFIGNSFVAGNNPEESFAYLRDFGTRFPDSLYAHDALIAYARALLATNRSSEAIRLLEAHRSPPSAETEYFLGKAYVQNGQGRAGAEVLRRVYYNYATNYTADNAAADLRKIPEAATLPPVTYAEHLKRAEALHKVRRYPAAADEYRTLADLAPRGEQSAALIQLANCYMHDGNT